MSVAAIPNETRPVRVHDCGVTVRPCPRTECRYSLVNIERSNTGRPPEKVEIDTSDSCALDVAEYGGETLEQVGRRIGVVRERVRQIEKEALRKLKAICDAMKETGGEL